MEMATEDETTLSELISDGLSAVNGSILLKNEEDVNSATLSSTQVELQLKDELPSIPGTVTSLRCCPNEEDSLEFYNVLGADQEVFHCQSPLLTQPNSNNNANTGSTHCSPLMQCQDPTFSDLPPSSAVPPPHQQPQGAPVVIPTGKITRTCLKHPHIEVTLDGKELWDEFYRRGTEMIVNRAGRRMFPGFSVSISGLKPKAKYTMKIDILLADNHRFKFLNARWLAVGSSEPQSSYETYLHPDSPNTGSFWMRHGVSFRKLKITNNKDKPGPNALLHSMHKYFLRLVIEEERKCPPGEPKQEPRPILSVEFPETTFIAVTAYQNEEVTQLKISNNPFAKAFRENAADLDWETAQALYGSSGYLSHTGPINHPGNYLMSPTTSPWALQSPMLSPLSIPPGPSSLPPGPLSLQSHHPQSHYSPESPHLRHHYPSVTTPSNAGYFQWPQYATNRTTEMMSPFTYHHQQHPSSQTIGTPVHPMESSNSSSYTTLPDFDSVFISSTTHS